MTHDNTDAAKTRILLVDDHSLFRSGVKLLLQRQPQFEVVGEAADGLEGVKRARELTPDVVLLDLNMPGLSGLEALQLIKEDHPSTCVLLLTVSEDSEDLATALRRGADGYLIKNIDADVLVRAIERAVAGESVIDATMTSKLVARFRASEPAPPAEADKLTPRERDILVGLARGQSNKEIARHLGVAESTVKIHVQNVLKKLGLTSRVQAAVYAVGHGLDGA